MTDAAVSEGAAARGRVIREGTTIATTAATASRITNTSAGVVLCAKRGSSGSASAHALTDW